MNVIYYKIQGKYLAKSKIYEGKKCIVVPVVMMVEGVHHGSAGPLLHPADELEKSAPAWNGIPVMLNHPEWNGKPISANSPEVLERWKVGRVFNVQYKEKKLTGEIWLEEQKLKEIYPELLNEIKEGKMIEVSVGVYTDEENVKGEWNGEQYEGISRNHRPDHLAILPEDQGACSIKDGCGIRQYKGDNNMLPNLVINGLRYSGTESTEWKAPTLSDFGVEGRWEDLSEEERSKIASHYLIGSASSETFNELKLPVVNPKTGKLNERALRAVISERGAMVKGVDAEVLSAARRRAYKLLNKEFDAGLEIPDTLIKNVTVNQSMMEVVEKARAFVNSLDSVAPSFSSSVLHFLRDVDEENIYYEEQSKSGSIFWKQPYQIGEIVLKGDKIQVVPKWEELKAMSFKRKENRVMSECKLKNLLGTYLRIEDKDKEWALQLPDEIIQNLEKCVVEPEISLEEAKEKVKEYVKSGMDKLLEVIPEEFKESVKEGVQLYNSQRKEMSKKILELVPDVYNEEELTSKKMEELTKIYKLVTKGGDYRGRMVSYKTEEIEPLLPPGIVESK